MTTDRFPRAAGSDDPLHDFGQQWREAKSEVRSIGSSIAEIGDELRVLLLREGELARAEIADNASAASRAAMWGGVAAILLWMTLIFAGLSVMYALAIALPLWAAALLTGLLFALSAAVCASMARTQLKEFSLKPSHTLHALEEDMKWAREQIKRNAA